jgi:hypothetical protein
MWRVGGNSFDTLSSGNLNRRLQPFSQMHNTAVICERNLVHERSHQVNSAPMSKQTILWIGRIAQGVTIKPFSFIPDRDRYFAARAAPAGDVNLFARILMISMDHGIRKRLLQRDFEVCVPFVRVAKVSGAQLDDLHESGDEWRDGFRATG